MTNDSDLLEIALVILAMFLIMFVIKMIRVASLIETELAKGETKEDV